MPSTPLSARRAGRAGTPGFRPDDAAAGATPPPSPARETRPGLVRSRWLGKLIRGGLTAPGGAACVVPVGPPRRFNMLGAHTPFSAIPAYDVRLIQPGVPPSTPMSQKTEERSEHSGTDAVELRGSPRRSDDPIIGGLHRKHSVTILLHSRSLVNKSVIKILRTHRFADRFVATSSRSRRPSPSWRR